VLSSIFHVVSASAPISPDDPPPNYMETPSGMGRVLRISTDWPELHHTNQTRAVVIHTKWGWATVAVFAQQSAVRNPSAIPNPSVSVASPEPVAVNPPESGPAPPAPSEAASTEEPQLPLPGHLTEVQYLYFMAQHRRRSGRRDRSIRRS
jgi:hypothetical protein